MWLQPAPTEHKIVVSEIGEAWSPKIAPAKRAPIIGTKSSGASVIARGTVIGIMIAKVPQEVPVEKLVRQETKKIRAGNIHKGKD